MMQNKQKPTTLSDIAMNILIRIFLTLLLLPALSGCEKLTELERIKENGVLIVATRNSPTTYYEGADGPTGFEYGLAKRFADELGVELKMISVTNLNDILTMVRKNEVNFAAAGLTITEPRKYWVRFGPPYQEITQEVVYRLGTARPTKIRHLLTRNLEVVADSSHAELLEKLQAAYPELRWTENPNVESSELLDLVWEQIIDVTIADSNELKLHQKYTPEIQSAFTISDTQQLAWAFPKSKDDSLYNRVLSFFEEQRKNGELKSLINEYYGHVKRFDYVGTREYMSDINLVLPKYQYMFETAGQYYDVDWRLLAAMGYQESHWDPDARSPTGVRGLMMLTMNTAKFLDIDDRLDPRKSIYGGAKYFDNLRSRIPSRIPEPDKTWMTVAAYNVGLGHLEDARVIAEKKGLDPDKWADVKETLPLLTRKKWYKKTRYGYARGWEPVRYVEQIRSYYDILKWISNRDKVTPEPEPEAFDINSPAL